MIMIDGDLASKNVLTIIGAFLLRCGQIYVDYGSNVFCVVCVSYSIVSYSVVYCIVLCCIVLYCIVFYCILLYCIVLYCIALYDGLGGGHSSFIVLQPLHISTKSKTIAPTSHVAADG